MRISIINGSPKLRESTSGLMIELLTPLISENEIVVYRINQGNLTERQFADIKNSDVLIFAFPLYVDSIPAHLLHLLIELEERNFFNPNTMVYCIVNNGFFEGNQNHVAVSQMKNWCRATGLTWGQAVGVGAGEMLPFLKDIPLGHGPNKNHAGNLLVILWRSVAERICLFLQIGQGFFGEYRLPYLFGIPVLKRTD